MPILYLIAAILAVFALWYLTRLRRQQLRQRLLAAPLSQTWIEILQRNLGLYPKLPDEFKNKLHGLINVFLHDKQFTGFNGLEITDEIKVTIAAQACMLILNRKQKPYPTLKNIYVYPDAFRSEQTSTDGMVQTTRKVTRIGESWTLGHVVLSWKHSKHGGKDEDDGHNVVYHEFAHQLDHEDGAIDGTPVLNSRGNYSDWRQIFSEEFTQHRNKQFANKSTIIDPYGAESEGEFFAVVTELFFEKPNKFLQRHPELYAELQKYYGLNPAKWF
jgi:Mlc titration factor MtfA (ptsG expression regulator)